MINEVRISGKRIKTGDYFSGKWMAVRKLPIIVGAQQIHEDFEIDTFEGTHSAKAEDYVIKGVRGELYPVKKDIFEETYEKVSKPRCETVSSKAHSRENVNPSDCEPVCLARDYCKQIKRVADDNHLLFQCPIYSEGDVMKRLIIEQLKEGYNLIDEAGDKYAVLEDTLSERVGVYFGLTKHEEKNNTAPPAKVSEATKPETQGSDMTAGSKPAGAILMTKRGDPEEAGEGEKPHHHEDILQSSSTEHSEKQPPQKPHVIHPSDLRIPKFEYDENKMQPYEDIFFQEFPDGAVVLGYKHSHYYTTKEKVLKIPYPFPEKYFSKKNGWSSNIEIAFKKYRKYLDEQETKKERQMAQNQNQEDDWKYHPMLKKDTKGSHGEDYEKIEGSLEE